MGTIKKITSMSFALLLATGLMTACGSEEAGTAENNEAASSAESNEEVVQPTLNAEFVQKGNNVTIKWDTSLEVSAEHYGSDHVDGEGHVHVYVDGEKVAGLKSTEDYVVEGLEEGKHDIKIELQQNNHETYGVSKTYEAEVGKQESTTPTLEASITQDGDNVTINWDTNIEISAEHYGGEHVEGEGHAHVYVDGEKVAGLKSVEPYTVEGLSAGNHEIEISLQQNDHESLNLSKSFEVEIN